MSAQRLNRLLIDAFPELEQDFITFTEWQEGWDTGSFVTYEDLLLPLVEKSLKDGNSEMLKRFGAFVESLLSSGDEYAVNVVTVGLLEALEVNGQKDEIFRFLGPRTKEVFPRTRQASV